MGLRTTYGTEEAPPDPATKGPGTMPGRGPSPWSSRLKRLLVARQRAGTIAHVAQVAPELPVADVVISCG
jgi:hypothetical protein